MFRAISTRKILKILLKGYHGIMQCKNQSLLELPEQSATRKNMNLDAEFYSV